MKAKFRKNGLDCIVLLHPLHNISKSCGVWIKNVEVIKQNISNLSNPRWPTCIHGYHGNGT